MSAVTPHEHEHEHAWMGQDGGGNVIMSHQEMVRARHQISEIQTPSKHQMKRSVIAIPKSE